MPPTTATPDRLLALLASIGELVRHQYPDHDWHLIGYPLRESGRILRLACPAAKPPPTPATPPDQAEEGSNEDLILDTLAEVAADLLPSLRELSYKATGGEPTGAFRRALQRLVRTLRVREVAGIPKRYDLPETPPPAATAPGPPAPPPPGAAGGQASGMMGPGHFE